ncbi:DNA/RNA nuclease SfsA [Lachnospiraceae bacterium JLR.KK009]|jgi:DNA-binding sugar fermentation-stimulating protein|nr:sugar fermentation stimulation protein [Lachnospiraceae bacterium A2]MCI8707522.1 DNA/RNA nuclease SfsA [Lachnospiraceae bacterium]MCI8882491.1 DNA/RNA nuclease SfsA [Lachnospiraceae bacterium]
MKYTRIAQGRFLERPNRFIALVEINGKTETCHVKNTGRCQELLAPGAGVWLEQSQNPNRKTAYDLVAVWKPAEDGAGGEMHGENPFVWQAGSGRLINIDSQAPNKAVQEWLEQNLPPCKATCPKDGTAALFGQNTGLETEESVQQAWKHPFPEITLIKPEYRYGASRIDFYIEAGNLKPRKILLEVKGVTLEENGIAKFPDAPTERGIRHMLELEHAVKEGYEAFILFLIQMKGIKYFEPNYRTHPQFGETLRKVQGSGVNILAYDCSVTPGELVLDKPVRVEL